MKENLSVSEMYKLTFPNGKLYIGISNNAKRRFQSHKLSARRKDRCAAVYTAMRKHGIDNVKFEVTLIGERSYILDLEQKAIALYQTQDRKFGYNIARGGETSPVEGRGHSDATRIKMSNSQKLRKRSPEEMARFAGKGRKISFSDDHKEKLRLTALARWSNPEERERARKTKKNTDGLKQWNANRPPMSEETKRKIGEKARQRHNNYLI